MKLKLVVFSIFAAAIACKQKPVSQPSAPAPTVNPTSIQSGIYMGSTSGSCLCVNAEKALAGTSATLVAMGTDLGASVESASDDMKAALKEMFASLKFVSKEQIVTNDGGFKYTRVQKANDCESLNNTMAEPVGYQDFCLEGKRVDKMKQF